MSKSTQEIVHTMNELIAELETRSLTLTCDESVANAQGNMMRQNDYKRALGQLKAARKSMMQAERGMAA